MLTGKAVRVLTCEEKTYSFENGKSGTYYNVTIRKNGKIFRLTSKEPLEVDTDTDLDFELIEKTTKTGNTYTTVRILGEAE